MPPRARKRACLTLAMNAARPSLLKPSRLISAPRLRACGTCAASDCPAAPAASPCRPRRSRSPSRRRRRCSGRSCRARRPGRCGSERSRPGDRHRVVHARLLDQGDQRRSLDRRQRRQGQLVRVLRIEPEQKRSGQREGNERHDGRRFWHRRAYFAARTPPMADQRIEKDTFGDIAVAADRLWGAQTERSLHHFDISTEKMPAELIRALAWVKRSAAVVNRDLGTLPAEKAEAIVAAADEVLAGRHDDRVPALGLADRLGHAEQHEHERGAREPRLAAARRAGRRRPPRPSQRRRQPQPVVERRLPDGDERRRGRVAGQAAPAAGRRAARHAGAQGRRRSRRSSRSAAPTCRTRRRSRSARRSRAGSRSSITAWRTSATALPHLCELALGGTAVGTGLNAPPEFGARVAAELVGAAGAAVRHRRRTSSRRSPPTTRSSSRTAR